MRHCRKSYENIKRDGPSLGIHIAMKDDIFQQYLMIQNKAKLLFFFKVDMPADFPWKPPKITHVTPFPVPEHPSMPLYGLVRHELLNTDGEGWYPSLALLNISLDIQLMTNELESNEIYYNCVISNVIWFDKDTPVPLTLFKDEIQQIWNGKYDLSIMEK